MNFLKNILNRVTPKQKESVTDLQVRDKKEIFKRVLSLVAIIGKVHQGNHIKLISWVEANSIKKYFTPNEKIFFETDEPTFESRRNFSWKAEALVSLLWSLKIIEKMPPLEKEFDIYSESFMSEIIENPSDFEEKISLRKHEDLVEMEMELQHNHWEVRDAELFNKEIPNNLNPEIVYERRYGMSWIVGWGDNWDNVPTDT